MSNTIDDDSVSIPPPRKKAKTDYYSRDVNFDVLAKHDADFAAISKSAKQDGWIDFHNPNVIQQLTKSLLKYDFGLHLSLPDDRLCPPIPVRWNYVRWIQDLLDTTSSTSSELYDPERKVMGLDIGVGASCIYSLLACASRPEWHMAGTDIDPHSLEYATRNVHANGFDSRIRLTQMTPEEELIPIEALDVEEMDFVMTNPPFYSSEQDFLASYNNNNNNNNNNHHNHDHHNETTPTTQTGPLLPSAVCIGAPNETICASGDVGFATRILEQSLLLRTRIQWYTTMLSHMHSVQQMTAKLKAHHITNFAVTALHPGHKTKRYAVAWSWRDYRPRNDVARHGELVWDVLPWPTERTIRVEGWASVRAVGRRVDETIKGLKGARWVWRELLDAGVMQCRENVWSRAAKRQRMFAERARAAVGGGEGAQKGEDDDEGAEDEDEDGVVALAVKITCRKEEVEVRWLRGQDYAVFESFCAMLQRTLAGKQR